MYEYHFYTPTHPTQYEVAFATEWGQLHNEDAKQDEPFHSGHYCQNTFKKWGGVPTIPSKGSLKGLNRWYHHPLICVPSSS